MPAPVEYRTLMGADVPLVAGVAKTVLAVQAGAGRVVVPTEIGIAFDATLASLEAVVVELCKCTFATAGTSTAVTPEQIRGPAVTRAQSGFKNYTAEPTVLAAIREWLVEPKSGNLVVQNPLGREAISGVGQGFAIRCTSPSAVNARGYLGAEE